MTLSKDELEKRRLHAMACDAYKARKARERAEAETKAQTEPPPPPVERKKVSRKAFV